MQLALMSTTLMVGPAVNRNDLTYQPIYASHLVHRDYLSGSVSPRENGKLKMRSNGLDRIKFVQKVSYVKDVSRGLGDMQIGQYGPGFPEYQNTYNAAYARFRGKVYEGSASLGVTMASAKQSADMIRTRYNQLTSKAAAAEALISIFGNLSRKEKIKRASGLHLEIIFGWTPLLEDVYAATNTLIQKGVPPVHVSASHSSLIAKKESVRDSGGWLSYQLEDQGVLKVKIGAQIVIDNPNLWLAERAGLLNPATVAWDLVPWSFVVNMFMNTGQLVQSLTDFSGLSVTNSYTSTTLKATRGISTSYRPPPRYDGPHVPGGSSNQVVNSCFRRPGIPLPEFQFKVPPLNLGTVGMAAALFGQKFSSIAGFLSPWIRK